MVRHTKPAPDAVTQWAKGRMPFLFQKETKATFFKRIERLYSPFDAKYRDIELAYDDAKKNFLGKTRDGGESYFEGHLVPVALIGIDYLEIRDYEIIIAYLQHDTIEDIPGQTEETLRAKFGRRVACIVANASEPKPSEYGGLKEAAEREFHSRFHSMDRDLYLVKVAGDRLHNLITLGARPRDKQEAKVRETEEHYLPQARKHLILLPELREVVQLWKHQFAQR